MIKGIQYMINHTIKKQGLPKIHKRDFLNGKKKGGKKESKKNQDFFPVPSKKKKKKKYIYYYSTIFQTYAPKHHCKYP